MFYIFPMTYKALTYSPLMTRPCLLLVARSREICSSAPTIPDFLGLVPKVIICHGCIECDNRQGNGDFEPALECKAGIGGVVTVRRTLSILLVFDDIRAEECVVGK